MRHLLTPGRSLVDRQPMSSCIHRIRLERACGGHLRKVLHRAERLLRTICLLLLCCSGRPYYIGSHSNCFSLKRGFSQIQIRKPGHARYGVRQFKQLTPWTS